MVALTLTVEESLARVGVQVTGAVEASASVERVHEDGSRHPVRGLKPFAPSGGAGFAWDYEAPLAQELTYEVTDGLVVETTTARLSVGDAWLRAPGLPSLDVGSLDLVRKPDEEEYSVPAVALVPLGGSRPVMVFGARQDGAGWRVRVRARTHVKARALLALAKSSAVLLLATPGTLQPWQYVFVRSVRRVEEVGYREQGFDPVVGASAALAAPSQWSVFELVCDTVDRPEGGVQGDPTASWQAIFDAHATWGDVAATYPTWLDVARGVASESA